MGVNPYRIYNHNVPIPNGRYRMLFHHLGSYKKYQLPMYFHDYPEFGTFSSASQVQLDNSKSYKSGKSDVRTYRTRWKPGKCN